MTLVSLVATTLGRLLAAGLREPAQLRCALVGGGPVPAALVERARFAGVPVAKTYGLTEACSQVSTQPVALLASSADTRGPGAEGGLPLFCTRLQIAPDGEILVGGPTVAPGALEGDGWLHTGDEGAIDERGHLLVSGRKSEMIVTGGESVAPAEIEAAVETHMGVLEAAVIGRADPEWGEAVTAIVVVEPGAQVEVEKLRAHCVRRLAPFKVPKQFILTYRPLPRTQSGKIARHELAAGWRTQEQRSWIQVEDEVSKIEDDDPGAAEQDPGAAEQDPGAAEQDARAASLERWDSSAAGWIRQQEMLRDFSASLTHWLIEAISPQPGHRLLELMAGVGETGLLAAELVVPGGEVIISDQSEAMLDGARERARELGVQNARFERMDAEWIDSPVATLDGIICRWGLMLLVDPEASLSEMRRVLRPGAPVALAVWDAPEHNPWVTIPDQLLQEHGLAEPRVAGSSSPGMFALADRSRLLALLEQAGFTEVETDALDVTQRAASFERFWEARLDIDRSFHDAVLSQPEPQMAALQDALAVRFEPFTLEDGSLALPGRTLVARASA